MKIFVCLLVFAAIVSCQDLQSIPGVPESLMNQARCALKQTVPELQSYSRGLYCRLTLHQKLKKAVEKLNQISNIIDVNNLVIGNNNAVDGDNNVVIGSNNQVNGDDNWLISMNKFNGKIDKTLVFRNWEIKMDKIDLILCNPNAVIKTLNKDQKNVFQFFWGNHQQQHHGGCNLFFSGFKQPQQQQNKQSFGWQGGNIFGAPKIPTFGCFGH